MVSYAQNFEDVMLARVFKGREKPGFYIDVGAMDPTDGSTTRHFYDLGWHGINIEPDSRFYERLVANRTRDINLNVALGEAHETRTFFIFEEQGISTFNPKFRDYFVERSYPHDEVSRELVTLADICREYVTGEIDFLKIDAEGWEGPIIRGADWGRYRPTVVLLESTEPFSHTPLWQHWENDMLGAGYDFAWYDGLNRFYVRRENKELKSLLSMPPNVLDDFKPYALVHVENELASVRHENGQLADSVNRLNALVEEERAGSEHYFCDLKSERLKREELAREKEDEELRANQLALGGEAQRIRAEQLAQERDTERLRADQLALERDAERVRAGQLAQERDAERLRADQLALEADAERVRAGQLARERDAERLRADQLALDKDAQRLRSDQLAREGEAAHRRAEQLERERDEEHLRANRLDQQRLTERLWVGELSQERAQARIRCSQLAGEKERETARVAELLSRCAVLETNARECRDDLEMAFSILRMDMLPMLGPEEVRVQIKDNPTHASTCEMIQVSAGISNTTNHHLISVPPYPVLISYHWYDSDGRCVIFDGLRSRIHPFLLAHSSHEYTLAVECPADPGKYALKVTLVQEGVRWLEEHSSRSGDQVAILITRE